MKLFKMTDRVKIKIDDIILSISPLSLEQKEEISAHLLEFGTKKDVKHYINAVATSVKYALKDIEGVTDIKGNKYELSFEEDGSLTKGCIEELLNTQISGKIGASCIAFIDNIPSKIYGDDGNALEGVEIINPLD